MLLITAHYVSFEFIQEKSNITRMINNMLIATIIYQNLIKYGLYINKNHNIKKSDYLEREV